MDLQQKRRNGLLRQMARVEGRLVEMRRQGERLTAVRLTLFFLGGAGSAAVLLTLGATVWAVTLPLFFVPFIVAVVAHRRLEASLWQHEAWLRLKQQQVARLQLDWSALPVPLVADPPADHPFAHDFDLIGARSLHHLLQTAVSHEGSQRLADWLLNPTPDLATSQRRQAQVRELQAKPLFCHKLARRALLLETESGGRWAGQPLLDWLQQSAMPSFIRPLLAGLGGLALLNGVLLLGSALAGWPTWWVASGLLYAALLLTQSRYSRSLFKDAWFVETRLRQLTAVFHLLETFHHAPDGELTKLLAPLQAGRREDDRRPTTDDGWLPPSVVGRQPSHLLRHLSRLVAAAGIQHNPLLWLLLNALLPWDLYFAYRLHLARQTLAALLPGWLDCWYELEALASLANFAYLNPATVYPTFLPPGAPAPCFAAAQLAHPLLPAAGRVGNDFAVDQVGQLFILTGSNMSGKSSFLRTLGVNLCLAYAGGTVVAEGMEVGIFRPFAAIRVTDSVVDGFSYFYAEVRRLRALRDALEQTDAPPLFFLIDEIFRGTNNRERLIGSRAYIQKLVGRNGVGLIATHDLELVQLADGAPADAPLAITNLHFRDDVVGGRMVFDYKLRPGPSPTTNALKIMELAGLLEG